MTDTMAKENKNLKGRVREVADLMGKGRTMEQAVAYVAINELSAEEVMELYRLVFLMFKA